MHTGAKAYVQTWGQDASKNTLNSVRVGGLAATSFGRELRVQIMGSDGRSVLETLTWQIDAQVSPDLDLRVPLSLHTVGAVLIAIE